MLIYLFVFKQAISAEKLVLRLNLKVAKKIISHYKVKIVHLEKSLFTFVSIKHYKSCVRLAYFLNFMQ